MIRLFVMSLFIFIGYQIGSYWDTPAQYAGSFVGFMLSWIDIWARAAPEAIDVVGDIFD